MPLRGQTPAREQKLKTEWLGFAFWKTLRSTNPSRASRAETKNKPSPIDGFAENALRNGDSSGKWSKRSAPEKSADRVLPFQSRPRSDEAASPAAGIRFLPLALG